MTFFTPNQIKFLLISWPFVLLVLHATAVFMSFSRLESNIGVDPILFALFFIILAAQITTIVYFFAGISLLALWFFGGRQRNLFDYALIMLGTAVVFIGLLRDTF